MGIAGEQVPQVQPDQAAVAVLDDTIVPADMARRRARNPEIWLVMGARVVVVLALIGLWQLFSGRVLPTYVISSPGDVASAFGKYVTSGAGWVDIRTTLLEVALGYVIGQVLGFFVGVLFGTVRLLGDVMEPLIAAANGIPHVALAPLFLIFLGIGIWSKVVIGVMIVFFVMFYNCYTGIRGIDQELVGLVRLYGANQAAVIRYVIIPGMFPAILSALSAGISFALIGAVVGEFIAAVHGVGNYITGASNSFDAANTYSGIIVLLIIVLAANLVFRAIQARLLRWQER